MGSKWDIWLVEDLKPGDLCRTSRGASYQAHGDFLNRLLGFVGYVDADSVVMVVAIGTTKVNKRSESARPSDTKVCVVGEQGTVWMWDATLKRL